jgi:hypothetical protein
VICLLSLGGGLLSALATKTGFHTPAHGLLLLLTLLVQRLERAEWLFAHLLSKAMKSLVQQAAVANNCDEREHTTPSSTTES